MKKSILSSLALAVSLSTFAQPEPAILQPPTKKKVQVAILFDTSNSMDGLIDQAKSRIWNIVNEISNLRHEGEAPTMEFALYEYGNDGLDAGGNFIRQVLNLTSDLDELSQKLFGLTTNGGSEYCGAVIQEALDVLAWTNDQSDLKMIYIAGNEEFNQGPIEYLKACTSAKSKSVYINSIFCGNYDEGVRMHWQDGSSCSGGDYFNIDSDKEITHIDTPYDDQIKVYNDSLNSTYFGYGSIGESKKMMQDAEDGNAEEMAPAVATERAVAKSKKGVYRNESWDLLDAVESGKDINEIAEEELPAEFKNKTDEEKKALIAEKQKERETYQEKIGELAADREEFIAAERKRLAESGAEEDDFGTSINKSISERAAKNGFQKEEK